MPFWLLRVGALGWRLLVIVALAALLGAIAWTINTVTASIIVSILASAAVMPVMKALRGRGWRISLSAAAATALVFGIVVLVLGVAAIVASLGTGWEPFVIVLMLGCSYAFIDPAGYQTSLMVMKPGGYTFTDFVRVGVPLTVLVGAVAVSLALLVYPT